MKLLSILAAISVSSASILDIRNNKCSDIVVDGNNQVKEILKQDLEAAYQLAVDYNTGYLFFSYTLLNGTFASSYIDLNSNEFGIISGIRGGFANAYDLNSRTLLIGGMDGIYEFDYKTKSGIKTNITNKNIWQIFAQDSIYFTTFPDEKAFVYENDEVKTIPGIDDTNVTLISVDSENNIFYYNSSGLFCKLNSTGDTIFTGNYVVIGFTLDLDLELYFVTPTEIYEVKSPLNIVKLARIVNMYGMVVASEDSIIYSDSTSIIRLKPDGTKCIPQLTVL